MSIHIKTIFVVLALPQTTAGIIVRVTTILTAMTESKSTFATPPVAFTLVSSHVDALSTAEAATKTRTNGTITARDAAKKQVITDITQLHAYVQQLANANPTDAETIAKAAAMTLRKTAVRYKHPLSVKQGISGTVHVVAKSIAGACSHEWQFSTDGGKTWVAAPPTAQASTTISNLPPGVMQFRQRVITRTGPSEWTPALTVAVS
jgi:hypothetical protein